jgi:toxin YoeB
MWRRLLVSLPWWSRRITLADRLVYRVTGSPPDQHLHIAQCRFHD